jgi:hypothetical protein
MSLSQARNAAAQIRIILASPLPENPPPVSPNAWVFTGSFVLALVSPRLPHDLDILVDAARMNELVDRLGHGGRWRMDPTYHDNNPDVVRLVGQGAFAGVDVDVQMTGRTFGSINNDCQIIDGFRCLSLSRLLEGKRRGGRPSDAAAGQRYDDDIALLIGLNGGSASPSTASAAAAAAAPSGASAAAANAPMASDSKKAE